MTQGNAKVDRADQGDRDDADPVLAQVKEMFDSVVDEPLPTDLLALLDKLDEAERTR